MAKILENMYRAMTLGAVLLLVLLFIFHREQVQETTYWGPFFTVLHVLSGITWIGLLYYFNLVQTPMMSKIPADLKPAISKYIAPEALFWFRWSALSTVITGLIVATLNGYAHQAMMLQAGPLTRTIGVGMWIGLVMAFNVWFIIWPNQKMVLGIKKVDDATKAKAARAAGLASRVNFVLSIPLLYCMVMARLVG